MIWRLIEKNYIRSYYNVSLKHINFQRRVINLKDIKKKTLVLGYTIFIMIISGIFIILSSIQINYQQSILEEQKQIINENRQWAEKITFWEVTGALGEDIIEGEKNYYDALSKYSAALQIQNLAILLIIILSLLIVIMVGVLIVKLF